MLSAHKSTNAHVASCGGWELMPGSHIPFYLNTSSVRRERIVTIVKTEQKQSHIHNTKKSDTTKFEKRKKNERHHNTEAKLHDCS
jgi:hypothetical protein